MHSAFCYFQDYRVHSSVFTVFEQNRDSSAWIQQGTGRLLCWPLPFVQAISSEYYIGSYYDAINRIHPITNNQSL